MNKKLLIAALVSFSLGNVAPAYASDKVFIDQKCNKCHAVSAYSIPKTGAEEDKDEKGSPDLSNAGNLADVPTLIAYLKKETPLKPGGKKHLIKFKGSEEELKSLAEWLSTLKKEPGR